MIKLILLDSPPWLAPLCQITNWTTVLITQTLYFCLCCNYSHSLNCNSTCRFSFLSYLFKSISIVSEVINCNLIHKSQAFGTALWSTNRSMYAFSYCLLFLIVPCRTILLVSLLYLCQCSLIPLMPINKLYEVYLHLVHWSWRSRSCKEYFYW